MDIRHGSLRIVALAVVVTLPLLGVSGVASAKVKAAKGCHKTHTCKSGGGAGTGGTGGTGGTSSPITVQVDPNPLVETNQSLVLGVIQVETSPSFAGDPVVISSSQLEAACGGEVFFDDLEGPGGPVTAGQFGLDSITVTLDDDGNATTDVIGEPCAPGTSVVEASLAVAPYYTALSTLVTLPPQVTTPGVFGYPTTSGTVTTGEVETGDTTASGNSDVIAIFYVETNPVYAEQDVEIGSEQLESRCGGGWGWFAGDGAFQPSAPTVSFPLDDDGNAVFEFVGVSCAAGPSTVIADVGAGTHTTYTTTYTIVAPQPTI
jgi:hypothetical protein